MHSRKLWGVLCLLVATGSEVPSRAGTLIPGDVPEAGRRGSWWDLQLEGGYGIWGYSAYDLSFFGRARAGYLWVKEPWYLALGPVISLGVISKSSVGCQVEVTNLWEGYWVQLGGEYEPEEKGYLTLAAGWSLVGLEWQKTFAGGNQWAVLVKLRVPIGILAFGLSH